MSTPDDLIATVEKTGYTAALPEPPKADTHDGQPTAAEDEDHVGGLRQRLLISAVLTVPVIAMAMVPALQFTFWQWASLTLAAPVVVWGAWPSRRC